MLSIAQYIYTQTPLAWFVQAYESGEAFAVLLAQRPVSDIWYISAQVYDPPLYYLCLKVWMALWGTSEIATRSLSLIFFTLSVFVVIEYQVHLLKYPLWRGILGTLVLSVLSQMFSPFALVTQAHALLVLCAITSTYALVLRHRKLYILTVTLGLLTHYAMILVIVIHGVLVLRRIRKST